MHPTQAHSPHLFGNEIYSTQVAAAAAAAEGVFCSWECLLRWLGRGRIETGKFTTKVEGTHGRSGPTVIPLTCVFIPPAEEEIVTSRLCALALLERKGQPRAAPIIDCSL